MNIIAGVFSVKKNINNNTKRYIPQTGYISPYRMVLFKDLIVLSRYLTSAHSLDIILT